MHNTSLIAALENLQARQLTSIFGLPFDVVSERQAIDHLISCIESNKRCFLSTPNLNFAIASQNNRSFRQSVLESDLSVADGMPLIWISKLAGPCLPERVAGSSVFQELYKTPANSKIKVFILAATQVWQSLLTKKPTASALEWNRWGFTIRVLVPSTI
jgi:Teichoic acid biosynthesis proteins